MPGNLETPCRARTLETLVIHCRVPTNQVAHQLEHRTRLSAQCVSSRNNVYRGPSWCTQSACMHVPQTTEPRPHPLYVLGCAGHPKTAYREYDRIRLQVGHCFRLYGLRVVIEAHDVQYRQSAEHVCDPCARGVRWVSPLQAQDTRPLHCRLPARATDAVHLASYAMTQGRPCNVCMRMAPD